ncbi:hypothetical protein EAE96_008351 [Botrytis aclada]|nr:hypothetical protein EAE96_008351 [Botrytis aclada]
MADPMDLSESMATPASLPQSYPMDLAESMATPASLSQQQIEPSFPRFNDFPLVIREKIWKYCLPEPRIVHMSSLKTRAQTHVLLSGPETWGPRSKLEFSFYENGNDLYRGDKTQPENSPLRYACSESRAIWQQNYTIPEIQLRHEWSVNLGVKKYIHENCRNGKCITLKASHPAPCHMIPHDHKCYWKKDVGRFHVTVRGFIDMKRDTLIMDPVVFSLVNGELGLKLDISKLRSIAYTSSIEYRPLWEPPGNDGKYEVVEGSQLFISDSSGYHEDDPDINENLIVEQASDARDALLHMGDLPTEKEKTIGSRDMWNFITQWCPQISSIRYILLGERSTAIWSKLEDTDIFDAGNQQGYKYEWEVHEHHLLPLYSSVRKIIMSLENTPIHSQGWGITAKSGLPIFEIQHHFDNRLNHGVQLEKDFQDYLKEHEPFGHRQPWHKLKFEVCALGDAVSLGPCQVAEDHEEAEMNLREDFFDVEPEGEIPIEFTNGNEGQIVRTPMKGDESGFLYLEMGMYIHWDPRGAPIQVTRKEQRLEEDSDEELVTESEKIICGRST